MSSTNHTKLPSIHLFSMIKKPFTLITLPSAGNIEQILKSFSFPIESTRGNYKKLELSFCNGLVEVLHGGMALKNFSFVWLSSGWGQRDIAYALRLYFESTGTPHSYVEKNTSKITDCMVFTLSGLPIPDGVFLSRSNIEQNLPLIKKVCGYPLIVKDIRGAKGTDSKYIAQEKELLGIMETLPKNKKFIFQKYIPNDYDWGIMVANGIVVSGEKSYPSDGEFRNNTCNGARECFIDVADIPQTIKDIAIKASELLGLSWSRSDIIINKLTGMPYLLEVNRYPGITSGSDEATGAHTFLASHIAPATL